MLFKNISSYHKSILKKKVFSVYSIIDQALYVKNGIFSVNCFYEKMTRMRGMRKKYELRRSESPVDVS